MRISDWSSDVCSSDLLNTDYDAYAPGARKMYFEQMRDKLVTQGFDAWWMDATEPDIHSNLSIDERIETLGRTAFGPAAALINPYPLINAEAGADGLGEAQPDKRRFIPKPTGFGGVKRARAPLWSGDVAPGWRMGGGAG